MDDIEDLFGDDMHIEEDDPVVDTPSGPPLRQSQSMMSISGESPVTAAATLFRPPQQRNTPASAPSRPPACRATVKKFADLLKLTKENHNLLQRLCENTLPGEEFVGTISSLLYLGQETRGPSSIRWVPGRVIRDDFKEQVAEFILRPDLQAYSKTVAEDHITMGQSLEVLTFNYLQGLKPEYIEEHGPGDYVAGEACIPTSAMHLFIKEVLKNQRSKVRSLLLTNILGVPEGSVLKVDTSKKMALLVARTLLPEVRALPDNEPLIKLGRARVKRIIFMRYVTVYYYLNQTENKKRCQWTLMDEALSDLRARPASDATLYFDRIARYDREAFNGKKTWATIKASGPLPPPFVDQVLAASQDTSSSGNGLEEGFEEEEQNDCQL